MHKPDKWDRLADRLLSGQVALEIPDLAKVLRRTNDSAEQRIWRKAADMCSDYEQPSTTTRRKFLKLARKPKAS